jgi:hypothetical protein
MTDRRNTAEAQVAQSAEHVLGKDEVGGSIPLLGSWGDRELTARFEDDDAFSAMLSEGSVARTG